jgi:type II secretory pathway component PulF
MPSQNNNLLPEIGRKKRSEANMEYNNETTQLLRKIEENSRRSATMSKLQLVFTVIAALCCLAAVVMILTVLPRVNGIITQMEHTLTNLEQISEELNALDMEGMISNVDTLVTSGQESLKQTMEKLDTIDLETMNQAIKDLAKIIEPLARLFGR